MVMRISGVDDVRSFMPNAIIAAPPHFSLLASLRPSSSMWNTPCPA